MAAFNILTLTCRLGRYSERPSLFFISDRPRRYASERDACRLTA